MPKRRKVTRTRARLTGDQIDVLVFGFCLDRGTDEVPDNPFWPWPNAEAEGLARIDYADIIEQCRKADLPSDENEDLFRKLVARRQ